MTSADRHLIIIAREKGKVKLKCPRSFSEQEDASEPEMIVRDLA
jgi:hypothetical protein